MSKDKKKDSITDIYLDYHDKYIKKYGDDTLILMQVGGFFECYSLATRGPNLKKISDLLNIICTKKNKSDSNSPYMLGFPLHALSKYLKVLIDNDYTTILIEQTSPPPNPKREITGIYSKGTYIGHVDTPDANNIMSIYIEEINDFKTNIPLLCIGISVIDLSTGKNILYETYSTITDKKYSLDETVKFINSYNPREIILNIHNKTITDNEIINYLELNDRKFYYNVIYPKDIKKINYQNEILAKSYDIRCVLTPIEYLDLERLTYSRISFVILLQYAYDHNNSIINNLPKPIMFKNEGKLYLGNNAMYQLNIIDTDKDNLTNKYKTGCKFKSLFDVVNKTSTAMGRRFLKYSLLHPLIKKNEIEFRYNLVSKLLENNNYIKYEELLSNINDIERLHRKLSIKSLDPIEFSDLHYNYQYILKLFKFANKNLSSDLITNNIIKELTSFIELQQSIFDIEEMSKYLINSITNSFFNIGINIEIDELQEKINNNYNYIEDFRNKLNELLDDGDIYIDIKYSDKEGSYFTTTKKRALIIEKKIKNINEFKINNDSIKLDKLVFKKLSTSVKITHPMLDKYTDIIKDIREGNKMQKGLMTLVKEHYINTLIVFHDKYKLLMDNIVSCICIIDFTKSASKCAIQYNYCKPDIIDSDKSFIKIKQLRHPIVEQIIRNEQFEYVPNDVMIGCDYNNKQLDGIMLFGLNSGGKSTLMKAIGLSVILAQTGYYVPASDFQFHPYNNLFTRISGQDNIFKGLSSFAIELLEMKSIIKRCCNYNNKSLVICDELCRGTENKSALILTQAFIEHLAKFNVNFISATHLHDITKMHRFNNLNNVKCFHLHVDYDDINDRLIYNRLLKEGSGESFYGLNVARHMIDDVDFLNIANDIKNEVFNTSLVVNKKSRYNTSLLMDKCMICNYRPTINQLPLETHHIIEQKYCNSNKFLLSKTHIHKNDKSNLCVLCQKCHDKIDYPIDNQKIIIKGYKNTSDGIILDYKIINVEQNKINDDKIINVEQNKINDDKISELIIELKRDNPKLTQKRIKTLLDIKHDINISIKKISDILKIYQI
jgi:DNA mismatch repair protein MutS